MVRLSELFNVNHFLVSQVGRGRKKREYDDKTKRRGKKADDDNLIGKPTRSAICVVRTFSSE